MGHSAVTTSWCSPIRQGLDPLAASVLDVPWSAGGRPVTLSLATVLCAPGSVPDHRRAAARLAPLKQAAKALRGASWVLGRADVASHEVRRGTDRTAAPAG
ncbi:EAL domain-containing protein OS=Streptomyces tendae OX=1932 GN=GUR47_32445 PE=4 SV=1 [Streptomyces tendae]